MGTPNEHMATISKLREQNADLLAALRALADTAAVALSTGPGIYGESHPDVQRARAAIARATLGE